MTDHNIVRMVHAIEERISGGGAADINSGGCLLYTSSLQHDCGGLHQGEKSIWRICTGRGYHFTETLL